MSDLILVLRCDYCGFDERLKSPPASLHCLNCHNQNASVVEIRKVNQYKGSPAFPEKTVLKEPDPLQVMYDDGFYHHPGSNYDEGYWDGGD